MFETPDWFNEKRGLRSYFENRYGEAWVAAVTNTELTFSGEDIDWKPHVIKNPDYGALLAGFKEADERKGPSGLDGIVLNAEERKWLEGVVTIGMALAESMKVGV